MANTYLINDDIKNNNIANIYLIYGKETYLKRHFRDLLVDKLLPTRDELNFAHFVNKTGKADETADIINKVTEIAPMPPFFSNCRVIVCENLGIGKKGDDKLNEVLKTLPSSTYIIFLETEILKTGKTFKLISEIGHVDQYEFPDRATLMGWARRKITAATLKISDRTLNEFIDFVSESLDNMDHELDKLISYCWEKGEITSDDIHKICITTLKEEAFELTNAIGQKDKRRVMAEYTKLYNLSKKPRDILGSIINSFKRYLNVYQAKEAGKSDEYIMKAMNFSKSSAIKVNYSIASSFGEERLKEFIQMGADYQFKLNTGLLEEQTGVEMFILKCIEIS